MRLLFLIVLSLGVAHAAPKKLAVLELVDHAKVGDAAGRYLTDRVRGVAADLDRGAWFVLTRENLIEVLPPGTDLAACEGDCEVETGRNVGADRVISGDVTRLGAELRVTLRLHDTQRGTLLGQETASASKAEALDAPLVAAAGRLLERLNAGDRPVGVGSLTLSGPSGLTVSIDGIEVGHTPSVTVARVVAGPHQVSVAGECFEEKTVTVTVEPERRHSLALAPPPRRARLSVQAVDGQGRPLVAEVRADDTRLGETPGEFEVDLCARTLLVRTDTERWTHALALEPGETAVLTARLGPKGPSGRRVEKTRTGMGWPVWAMLGGMASLGMGVSFALQNQADGAELRDNPGDDDLRARVDGSYSSSVASYAVGGALVLTGLGFWLFGGSDDDDTAQRGVGLQIGPAQVGVGGTW